MRVETTGIRINGRDLTVPSVQVCGCTVIVTGSWLKTGQIFDEELFERNSRPEVASLVTELRRSSLRADVFTFGRSFFDVELDVGYRSEPDNIAVAPTASFEAWWNSLSAASRKNARLAEKRGVVVRPVEFGESLVAGIKRIYDETPVRQGRRFWHFQKALSRVWAENITYLSRSQFIGAYVGDELIGFIKYVRVDDMAVLIQVLAMESHRDKKPMNALLKRTVELCEQQGMKGLVYGKFDYGAGEGTSLAEFKRRNGFEEKKFPRYVVPLSLKGRVGIQMGMHRGFREVLPVSLVSAYRMVRARAVGASKRHGSRDIV
jgi:hypothetical protein